MRMWIRLSIIVITLGLAACTRQENDSAAREAGRTAHKIATKTEEAAKKASRKLEQAAREARDGWKEAEREEKAKPRK
jgi:hypothetical protein